jgi:hypothetical protein
MTADYTDRPGYAAEPGYPVGGGYPPGGGPVAPRYGGGMATAALVLGIIAILTSFTVIGGVVLGLLAIVLGIVAARRAKRGLAPGRGRAVAGIITGAIGLLLSVALIAFGVSLLNSSSVKNLQTCVKNANGDQAAIQKCDQEFVNQNK